MLVAGILTACSLSAILISYHNGWLLYYGDAQAHLNIARRVTESRTPGFDQLGTVWLPLPHLLMVPFARNNLLWRTGLAGSIPSSMCFVGAGALLFAALNRIFDSRSAAGAGTAVLALNPNLLYLQSTAMTEPVFFAALMGLLYCTVRFRDAQSLWTAAGAGLAACAGTLTRYEGWFLIPFATVYFIAASKRNRLAAAGVFALIASLGPLFWLVYNRWYFGDFLEFYLGPYSPLAIQGASSYPGYGDWLKAARYFGAAATLGIGGPALLLAGIGILSSFWRRTWLAATWPVMLLLLPPLFYEWSIHSSHAVPVFVPNLWPFSYYNTRYGLALLPLAALGVASLVMLFPQRRAAVAFLLAVAAIFPWVLHRQPESWITWKESQVNSEDRREWTRQAAQFLRQHYRSGDGIFTTFGDVTGIFCEAGIPLRETLTGDNEPHWMAAAARPDLFLWERWAVAVEGDRIQQVMRKSPSYMLATSFAVKGARGIEIYRRISLPIR